MTRNWETQAVFNWISNLSADADTEWKYDDVLNVAAHGDMLALKDWVEANMIGDDIYENHIGLATEFITGCMDEVWWDHLLEDLRELAGDNN